MEHRIACAKDLLSGKMMGFTSDSKEILVVNYQGRYYAMSNNCTHKGCKLSSGTLVGSNIECPCHGSVFDVKTGKVVKGPAKKLGPTLKIGVKEDQIVVDC